MKTYQNNQFLFDPDKVNDALKSAKTIDDLFEDGGALQMMLKKSMETMLKGELEDHLGYSHGDSKRKKTTNARNGSYQKSVKTTAGKLALDIPRDREGTFQPKAVPKMRNGVPLFTPKKGAKKPNLELINQLRDEE